MSARHQPRFGQDKSRGWYIIYGLPHPNGGPTKWQKQYLGKHTVGWSATKVQREHGEELRLVQDLYARGEFRHPNAPDADQPGTLAAAHGLALDAYCAQVDKAATRNAVRNLAARLLQWLNDRLPEVQHPGQVTRQLLTQHLDAEALERGWSGRRYNNVRALLKRVWTVGIDRGHLPEPNPWDKVPRRKEVTSTRNRVFSEAEQQQLWSLLTAQPEPWLLLSVELLWYCFVRGQEQLRLQRRDIDLRRGLLLVKGKNRKVQQVTIPPVFLARLRDMTQLGDAPSSDYLFSTGLRPGPNCLEGDTDLFSKPHRLLVQELGLSDEYTWYSWKHTAASMLATRQGWSVMDISRHMRHTSVDMTARYLRDLGVLDDGIRYKDYPALGGG